MQGVWLFISGGAGVGKTTVLRTLEDRFPAFVYQDLDALYLDDTGETCVDVSPASKAWLQGKLDAFIFSQEKPIILAGINFLDNDLRATHRIVLDTRILTVMARLWHRAPAYGENRWLSLWGGFCAWRVRCVLIHQGFLPMTEDALLHFIEGRLTP